MKKILLIFTVLFLSVFVANAQDDPDNFTLTEQESFDVIKSTEFQNFMNLQDTFLIKIKDAVANQISLDSIRIAALNAINNNDTTAVYTILFGDVNRGYNFFTALSDAKRALLNTNSFMNQHTTVFSCSTCATSIVDQTNWFFQKFYPLDTAHSEYGFTTRTAQNIAATPTCGSWWNVLRLGVCATGCSIVTGGLATVLCGWGCWCQFCSSNSALSLLICND